MPFRDHFRPPVSKNNRWEVFHGGWPYELASMLNESLPPRYFAEPRVQLGTTSEIDLGALDRHGVYSEREADGGGVATLPYTVPQATSVSAIELADVPDTGVEIYDSEGDLNRTLVAAVEFVSPRNKDRPAARRDFVAKCSYLLQRRVTVSIVDPVTVRTSNLFVQLLDDVGADSTVFGSVAPSVYAATLRPYISAEGPRLVTWAYPLVVGQPLPELPTFLGDHLAIRLDLDGSYEETCRKMKVID